MLKTEKLLNSYGLTFSEAEALLEVDVLSSLMKAKENDKLALHVSSLDERITQYLQTQDIKDILDANRKEAIGEVLVDDFEQDLSDFDLDFDDLEGASGFDVRVTDIDIDDIDIDIDEIDPPQSDSPIMTPAPKLDMANALIFQNVSASNFFTQLVKMQVPEVDSDGALVFNSGKVLIRGLYESNFSRLGSMALSNADMVVEIVSMDTEAVVEYKDIFADGGMEKVDKDILSFSREEVSKVFNTQQYLKNGVEVNTSFDAIKSILDKQNKNSTIFDKSVLDFSVGKAVHPNMVVRSNFYITPKTLYGLANCDEFFSASVGGYRYITNYCEANDLKQLRIFEIGGSHLNVPFSNTRNETITDSIVQDEFSAFSSKVGGIVQDTYTQNESLYEVGFTQILPKEIKYDKVDTLSESAGYFVFCSPNSARTFYIPAVVYNYFKKFYGIDKVKAGTTTHNGLYTLYFVNDSNVQGFIMIDKENAPSSSPARLLPTNPLEYAQKIVGENALAFTNKVDIEDENSIEFMGEVKPRTVVEETSLNEFFKEQILLFEQALEFMEVGDDDEQITLLKEAIEGAKIMLGDDDEEQAEEGIEESIDMVSAPQDELGQVAVANDQDILPTPSADDPVMEEIIEEEKEDVLDVDLDDFDIDIDVDIDDDDYDISDYYEKGGQTDDVGNPTDPLVLERMEVFIANQIPTLDKETYFTHGMQRKEAKRRFYEKYEYGAYNPKFSFDFFAKGGKVEDGNSTAIPITGSLEGVDVKKVFEEGSAYHDFHEYTREEKDAIKKSEGSESDAYNAITLPKNFPWQTAEIISSVDPFEFITESTGWLVENGYDPKKYALWVHPKFGKNPKLLTNLITQNDESYFDVVFLVEISKDQKEYLERSNPFRSSYYAKGGEVSSFVNNLQKGDLLKIKFGSIARRDNEVSLKVRSRNKIRNGRIDKITFENVNQPDGVRFYAYERGNGVFSFAMGDLAISNIEIVSDYAKGGEVKFDNDYYGYSARVPYKGEHFLVEMGKNWNAPLKEVAVTQNMRLVDEVMARNVYLKMLKNKPMTPPEYAKGGKTKESVKAEIDEGLKDLEEGLEGASKKHKAQSKVVSQIRSGIKESFAKGGGAKLFRPTKKQMDEMKTVLFNPNISTEQHEDFARLGLDKTKYSPKLANIGRWVDISNKKGLAYQLPYKIISLQRNYDNEIIYRGANQNNSFGTPISDKNIKRFITEDEASKMYNENIDQYIDQAYNYSKGGKTYAEGGEIKNHSDIISLIEDSNTYMTLYDESDKDLIMYSTRENGSVGEELASDQDVDEAIRLQRILESKFNNIVAEVEVVDEWVSLNIRPIPKPTYRYIFHKHSRPNANDIKGSGFSESYDTFDEMVKKRETFVGGVNWKKVKKELDNITQYPNNQFTGWKNSNPILISEPNDKDNDWGYYFSVSKSENKNEYSKGGSTYAEGGEVDTASEIAKKMVSSMTDDDVANKVIESIYGSLESLESDIKEEDALIMAKKDMKSTRRFYEDILKDSILS